MPSNAENLKSSLASLSEGSTHRDVEQALLDTGWVRCGEGEWAVALRSPDGAAAARISPFDPVGPFTAALYREAAKTRQVPKLHAHHRLYGGGDLQLMEWLLPVPQTEAFGFLQMIAERKPEVAVLGRILRDVHEQARKHLPWCGPLDDNPSNVMRAVDGRLVLTDPYYADGPNLYEAAATTPDLVVAKIPRDERRFITEIPLAGSGGWDPKIRERIRKGLETADFRASGTAIACRGLAVNLNQPER